MVNKWGALKCLLLNFFLLLFFAALLAFLPDSKYLNCLGFFVIILSLYLSVCGVRDSWLFFIEKKHLFSARFFHFLLMTINVWAFCVVLFSCIAVFVFGE